MRRSRFGDCVGRVYKTLVAIYVIMENVMVEIQNQTGLTISLGVQNYSENIVAMCCNGSSTIDV
jgi:hypothetical protein